MATERFPWPSEHHDIRIFSDPHHRETVAWVYASVSVFHVCVRIQNSSVLVWGGTVPTHTHPHSQHHHYWLALMIDGAGLFQPAWLLRIINVDAVVIISFIIAEVEPVAITLRSRWVFWTSWGLGTQTLSASLHMVISFLHHDIPRGPGTQPASSGRGRAWGKRGVKKCEGDRKRERESKWERKELIKFMEDVLHTSSAYFYDRGGKRTRCLAMLMDERLNLTHL